MTWFLGPGGVRGARKLECTQVPKFGAGQRIRCGVGSLGYLTSSLPYLGGAASSCEEGCLGNSNSLT